MKLCESRRYILFYLCQHIKKGFQIDFVLYLCVSHNVGGYKPDIYLRMTKLLFSSFLLDKLLNALLVIMSAI